MQVSSGDVVNVIQPFDESSLADVTALLLRINEQNDFMIALIVTIAFVVVCYVILKQFSRI